MCLNFELRANAAHEASKVREGFSKLQHGVIETDSTQQEQINALITAIIQNAINLHDALNRRDNALDTEAEVRHSEDAGILDQIHLLSLAGTKETLNFRQASNRRKSEALNETQTRSEQDDGLQVQIDTLADTTMRQMTENLAVRRRIINDISNIKQTLNDIYDALVDAGTITYRGARIATSHEISDMLSDVLSGSDDGEISVSEIPEDLKGDIATREEVSEMLDEVFNNRS